MFIKNTTVAIVLLLCSTFIQAEISGNIALSTEYMWRGISQTDGELATSGGFDYEHEQGFYAGVWGSNVNFGTSAPESLELDIYGGWATELDSGIGLDVGIIGYTYHGSEGASAINFTEYFVGASYQGFGAYYYIGDSVDPAGDPNYLEISYGYDFEKISLSAVYGNYDGFADPSVDYSYYGLGLSTSVYGIDLALNWTDNDTNSTGDSNLVFSISKSL